MTDSGERTNRLRSFRDVSIGFVAGFAFFLALVNIHDNYVVRPTNEAAESAHSLELQVYRRKLEALSERRDFLKIATKTGTDKVWGYNKFKRCLEDPSKCANKDMANPKCRVLQGHFYNTMYNKWLGPYSTDDAEPFQFLEIGHYNGKNLAIAAFMVPEALLGITTNPKVNY